jgi:hypothetical protein
MLQPRVGFDSVAFGGGVVALGLLETAEQLVQNALALLGALFTI